MDVLIPSCVKYLIIPVQFPLYVLLHYTLSKGIRNVQKNIKSRLLNLIIIYYTRRKII